MKNLSHFNKTRKHEKDGHIFDSRAEFNRYCDLLILLRAGEISDLQVHPRYILEVNGKRVSSYKPDFEYILLWDDQRYPIHERTVEDVKPFKKQGVHNTLRPWVKPYDRLRHKMFAAIEGVEVTYIK